jgi:hypothetical protein
MIEIREPETPERFQDALGCRFRLDASCLDYSGKVRNRRLIAMTVQFVKKDHDAVVGADRAWCVATDPPAKAAWAVAGHCPTHETWIGGQDCE